MNNKNKTTHNYNNTNNHKNGKKIKNWREYDLALAKRGDFTVLVKEA